jgi:hypothetical protein
MGQQVIERRGMITKYIGDATLEPNAVKPAPASLP